MNEPPKHQNKQGDHGSCQSFPQQVQAHFGLPLRLAAVTVIPATLPESAIVIRCISLCHERFYSPDCGVAVHFRASRTSAASVALRRRFFFRLWSTKRIAMRDKLSSTKESGRKNEQMNDPCQVRISRIGKNKWITEIKITSTTFVGYSKCGI